MRDGKNNSRGHARGSPLLSMHSFGQSSQLVNVRPSVSKLQHECRIEDRRLPQGLQHVGELPLRERSEEAKGLLWSGGVD